jgi:hypothetical protein
MATEINIEPGHGRAGRQPTPQLLERQRLSGHDDPGMFGRMFPDLAPLKVEDGPLMDLAKAMLDANPGSPEGNIVDGERVIVPAGFTYLGQFVDHDITLDMTSIGDKIADPEGIDNFRTPALDLDAIYGLGPDGSRQLYARNPEAGSGKTPGPKFLIGKTINVAFGGVTGSHRNDLPRNPEGFALIGDHRNDENLVVAQTHLAFLKFHNAVCDRIAGPGKSPEAVFSEARRIVSWHYQWMVLHDFVERITEPGIVARILERGRKFYRFKKLPYMPVEFSAAAYRFGHSMVRARYSHNRIFTAATLEQLFDFTGLSGGIIGDLAPVPSETPLPQPVLPSNWIIDWRRYFDFGPGANPGDVRLNPARKIDPFLIPKLHELPGGGGNLAFRNLKRGVFLELPSGQSVAGAMNVRNPLTPDEIASGDDGAVAKRHGLHLKTPLWYYILKEASVRGEGKRLGPVGATIVAEVLIGLVHGDHESYLWRRGVSWRPDLPSKTPGTFAMTDLLRFVGDISPLDNIGTLP